MKYISTLLLLFFIVQNICAQQEHMEIYVTDIIAIPQNSMSEFVTIPLQTKLDKKLYSFSQDEPKIIAFNPYNTTRDYYHAVKLNSSTNDYEIQVIVPPNRFANMYFVTTLTQDESPFLTVEFSLYHKSSEDVLFSQSQKYDKVNRYKLKWNQFINTFFKAYFSSENIATWENRLEELKTKKAKVKQKRHSAHSTVQTVNTPTPAPIKPKNLDETITIAALQKALRDRGYDPGSDLGISGKTQEAINKFQEDNNLRVGRLDKKTLDALGIY